MIPQGVFHQGRIAHRADGLAHGHILPNSKLLNYGYIEQLKDVLPSWLMSGVMLVLARLVGLLGLPTLLELVVMVAVGVVSYVAMSAIFRVESFGYILNLLTPMLKKLKRK